ncbi:hypothetical protein A1S_2408 [Acinetobacter baumannii ATCC 17978]|nr:hypothetical protein A1S_2408 [Acinetobacter baumannii ATCC 17978]
MSFNFNQSQATLFKDNPWGEYWLATLSAMFPAGERFFVHSVRNLQNQAKTERLQKDIAAFIGQEAMHAKEHEHLNLTYTVIWTRYRACFSQCGMVNG